MLSVPVGQTLQLCVQSVHTLPLSVFSCLKCSRPSLVASQKMSDEESLLEPESSDDRSTACDGGEANMKPVTPQHYVSVFKKTAPDSPSADSSDQELRIV